MPVYEYFCPHCSRELEVLRPIRSASEYSDCPDCGGKAWRLLSGFGSRTGSYLQPSGMPFRDESGWQASRSEIVATVTRSDVDTGSTVDDQQASSGVEMSWLLESQPNGSNIWFVPNWGIASILRYLREGQDVKLAERTPYLDEVVAAKPVESPVDASPGVDQRIEPPSVRPWPDERTAEPAKATESHAKSADVPMVAYAEPRAVPQSREPAIVTRTEGQATGALARHWLPTSYFGWFMLLVACIAAAVVPLVWILTVIF